MISTVPEPMVGLAAQHEVRVRSGSRIRIRVRVRVRVNDKR